MIERKSDNETVIILHKNNDFNQPMLVREIEIIVNRMVKVFNDMGQILHCLMKQWNFLN